MIEILSFILGPVDTNAYLVGDPQTGQAVVIDPAWDGDEIIGEARRRGWRIAQLWLTHAHFDHIGGVGAILKAVQPSPPVALHPDDLPLWKTQGGAPLFGMHINPGPEPTLKLAGGQVLMLGENKFEVCHTPGHTTGHVVFSCKAEKLVFCGDLIFAGSVGRTDLPGGSYDTLIYSIRTHILSLPDETRLLSGHGPETTVGEERATNPFL